MQLNTVDKEKPTKKFVVRKGHTSNEEVEKNHPPPIAGARDHLVAGEAQGSLIGEDSHLLELLVAPLAELRSLPPGYLRLLHRSRSDGCVVHLL